MGIIFLNHTVSIFSKLSLKNLSDAAGGHASACERAAGADHSDARRGRREGGHEGPVGHAQAVGGRPARVGQLRAVRFCGCSLNCWKVHCKVTGCEYEFEYCSRDTNTQVPGAGARGGRADQ